MAFLAQRFECKYLVPVGRVPEVRAAFLPHVVPDPYSERSVDRSYWIHSLYLDSPELDLFHSALYGERNRMKLRLRFYQETAKTVFAEIKQRKADVIFKQRAAVTPDIAAQLVRGQLPPVSEASEAFGPDYATLLNFSRWSSSLAVRPASCVSYRREAWTGRETIGQVRVTLDKGVYSERREHLTFLHADRNGTELFPGYWILELKYTDRYPVWFRDLVLRFGLDRRGAAKYVEGMRKR